VTNAHRTLVVVAHRGGARLFEFQGLDADWALVAEIDHPEGTAKTSELVSDRQGQVSESHGDGQHASQPRVDPTEQVADRFAHALAERLRQLRVENDVGRLVLVAPAPFLGLLRAALDDPTAKLVAAELAGGFAHEKPEAIRKALSDKIAL